MCVIVTKIVKKDIEKEKLESAFLVNPDGWGISRPLYNGKLETIKGLKDQKAFYDYYDKWKDKSNLYFHMRFRTQGNVNLEMSHPYRLLNFKEHKVDLDFFHNGTLHRFSGDKEVSDTYKFGIEVAKPLLEMALAKYGAKEFLKAPILQTLLREYAGLHSKFLFVDGYGNVLITNEKEGDSWDWGWSSNKYSFDRFHREDKTNVSAPFRTGPTTSWKGKDTTTTTGTSWRGDTKGNALVPWKADAKPLEKGLQGKTDAEKKAIAVLNARDVIHYSPELPKDELMARPAFIDQYGFESIEDVCCMSASDIEALCVSDPKNMTLLIQDLLLELYERNLEGVDDTYEAVNAEVGNGTAG